MTEKSHIVMLLWNAIEHDARVLKEARSLQENGYEVTILALRTSVDQPQSNMLPSGVRVQRVTFLKQRQKPFFAQGSIQRLLHIVRLLFAQLRMTMTAVYLRPSLVHAHDINTVIPAAITKKLARAKLIYDAHEFAMDRMGYQKLRWLVSLIESCIIPRVDGMISTSASNSKAYARLYGSPRPTILGNMPLRDEATTALQISASEVRAAWGVPEGKKIILYQGGLAIGRGLPCLIEAMTKVRSDGHLVLMGNGPLKETLLQQARELSIAHRLSWHPSVSLEVLASYTAAADVGAHPLEDICRNHRWASPNKLYEYIHAGLPVVMSSLAEPKRTITVWDLGKCFEPGNSQSLADALNELLADEAECQRYAKNSQDAAQQLTWKAQEMRLVALYKNILSPAK